ncbi:hypothetical protein K0A97_03400 [Patescibacteria group bacterium]|nr:hypothetical protein [Patescibacteria group bacterium]
MKKVYRGIWVDKIEDKQELPIGGSIFDDELTLKVILNFENFREQINCYESPQKVSEIYNDKKQIVLDWLSQVNSKMDPYLFFVTNTVQRKVQELMDVNLENPPSDLERIIKFKDNKARLTDLRGISGCVEQASLGQYLLQNILQEGYSSCYMSGAEDSPPPKDPKNHSFIVIKDPISKTHIFDISRPYLRNNLPRVLETDIPFTYELFEKTQNLLVGATEEVLPGGRLYFGVGHSLFDQKLEVIDNKRFKK